jgi:hypothetical protein
MLEFLKLLSIEIIQLLKLLKNMEITDLLYGFCWCEVGLSKFRYEKIRYGPNSTSFLVRGYYNSSLVSLVVSLTQKSNVL